MFSRETVDSITKVFTKTLARLEALQVKLARENERLNYSRFELDEKIKSNVAEVARASSIAGKIQEIIK